MLIGRIEVVINPNADTLAFYARLYSPVCNSIAVGSTLGILPQTQGTRLSVVA